MELRRVAEVLVRSQTSPLASLLAPLNTTRWATGAQRSCRRVGDRSIGRPFGTSSHRNGPRIPVTTTAPPPSEQFSSTPGTEANTGASFKDQESTEAMANSIWATTPRTPHPFKEMLTKEKEKRFNGGSTSSDLLSALNKRRTSSGSIDVSKMLDPLNRQPGQNSTNLMSDALSSFKVYAPPRKPLTLNASTGRSITVVSGNIDVGRGFKLLEQSCNRNKVKHQSMMQRFHERGGLKRKRLRRERWRRKFMDGFRAAVDRVKVLRKQGW